MGPKENACRFSKKCTDHEFYTSVHAEKVREMYAKGKSPCKSIGPNITKPDPTKFTQRNLSNVSDISKNKELSQSFLAESSKKERRMSFNRSNIDNSVEIKTKPTRTKSQLEAKLKKYMNEQNQPKEEKKLKLGRIPNYVKQHNFEKKKAEAEKNSPQNKQENYLSEGEKKEILNGLKKNWEKVNRQYQILSVIIDTPSKKQHKLELEQKLTKLESDIDLIKKSPTIIVV